MSRAATFCIDVPAILRLIFLSNRSNTGPLQTFGFDQICLADFTESVLG